ncbi:MAG: DUF4097 family beta strand repeat-containing protein [Candidatus Latescibacterota bacterium]
MKKRITIFCACLLLAIAGMTALSFAETIEEFNKTCPISAGTIVNVTNVNGRVAISTWDQSIAEVRAVKKTRHGKSELDAVTIEVTYSGNTLDIKTVYPRNRETDDESFFSRISHGFRDHGKSVTVDYTISLPETAMLGNVRTTNGNVELRETYGNTAVSSTNGSVIIENAVGIAEAHTTNGNVLLRNTRGNATVHTTNGSITVENAEGEISAWSTNGSISLNGVTAIKEAHTTNGAIRVGVGKNMVTDMSLATTNGAINISFPQAINADFDLSTSNGKVIAPGGLTMTVETISSKRLIAKLGTGGSKIRARTTNGSITLNKQ